MEFVEYENERYKKCCANCNFVEIQQIGNYKRGLCHNPDRIAKMEAEHRAIIDCTRALSQNACKKFEFVPNVVYGNKIKIEEKESIIIPELIMIKKYDNITNQMLFNFLKSKYPEFVGISLTPQYEDHKICHKACLSFNTDKLDGSIKDSLMDYSIDGKFTISLRRSSYTNGIITDVQPFNYDKIIEDVYNNDIAMAAEKIRKHCANTNCAECVFRMPDGNGCLLKRL